MLKIKTVLLTVLILLLSAGTVLAITQPAVSVSGNKVTVTGKTDGGDDITIVVADENGTKHYIDQCKSDENGNYSFQFSLKDGKYICKVSTGLDNYEAAFTVKSGTGSEPGDDDDEPGKPHVPGGSTSDKPQELNPPRKSFIDVNSHWARDEIEILAGKGIISGMSDDYFMPDEKITRAQFASMLFRLLELKSEEYKGLFSDVSGEDWYSTTVESVAKAGIVMGSENKFYPNKEISREEMAVMIIRALEYKGISTSTLQVKFNDMEQISSWALESVGKAVSMGIIKGMTETAFEPKLGATRAQAAVMMYRLIELL